MQIKPQWIAIKNLPSCSKCLKSRKSSEIKRREKGSRRKGWRSSRRKKPVSDWLWIWFSSARVAEGKVWRQTEYFEVLFCLFPIILANHPAILPYFTLEQIGQDCSTGLQEESQPTVNTFLLLLLLPSFFSITAGLFPNWNGSSTSEIRSSQGRSASSTRYSTRRVSGSNSTGGQKMGSGRWRMKSSKGEKVSCNLSSLIADVPESLSTPADLCFSWYLIQFEKFDSQSLVSDVQIRLSKLLPLSHQEPQPLPI